MPQPNFTVCIEPGVALGCDGYPIELCAPIKLNLNPDPCCDPRPDEVYIAIRRQTSDDTPRQDCGCQSGNCGCGKSGNGGASSYQCTRLRDHVEIRVFNKLKPPPGLCALPEKQTVGQQQGAPAGAVAQVVKPTLCDCLKTCSGCDACGESLGSARPREDPETDRGRPTAASRHIARLSRPPQIREADPMQLRPCDRCRTSQSRLGSERKGAQSRLGSERKRRSRRMWIRK